MVKTWSSENAGETPCPKCGTRYRVTVTRLPARDHDHFDCNVCGYRMDSWNDTHVPSYVQISGPEKESPAG